jgi:Domain of unknown function (DUF5753)
MSDDAYGATIAKRRLARELTTARINAGYTANHACDILSWGRGKVGRFEANQWKRPEMSDIRDLIRIYGIEEDKRDEIEDLAIRARARAWWREYPEIFDSEFPGYENDATTIRVFMPLVLPGLLQTPAYTEALMRSGPRPPAYRRKAVDSRLRRQEILDRKDGTAPMVSAVITEASLLYRWGLREDRREQIEHLVAFGAHRNVNLRIQRFEDGPPIGIVSMVNIFGFRDDEPSLVFVETDYSIEEVSKPESVQGYIESFERASDAALEPADTTGYLEHLAKRMELSDDRPVSGHLAEGPPKRAQRRLRGDRSQPARRSRRAGQQATRGGRPRRRPGLVRRVPGRCEGGTLRPEVVVAGYGKPPGGCRHRGLSVRSACLVGLGRGNRQVPSSTQTVHAVFKQWLDEKRPNLPDTATKAARTPHASRPTLDACRPDPDETSVTETK